MIEPDKLKKAVERLYDWQYRDGTSFTCQLYSLFGKADPINKIKLFIAFPEEAAAYTAWHKSDDPDVFFESHGLGLSN